MMAKGHVAKNQTHLTHAVFKFLKYHKAHRLSELNKENLVSLELPTSTIQTLLNFMSNVQ